MFLQRLRHSAPINQLRYHAYKTLLSLPSWHVCNLCEWSGRRFLTFHHRHVLCPRCGSQVRHRLIAAALAGAPTLIQGAAIDDARILHVSPEYCLESQLRPRARRYVTADYTTSNATVRMSLNAAAFRSSSFDTVICCDVLEHLPDDAAAMAEIRRVLKPGGVAILTVPTQDGLAVTFEDPSIVAPEERQRVYGQSDHVRNYGADFVERVERAGFTVSVVKSSAFSCEVIDRHVLAPPVPLTTAPACNDRCIFFSRAR